MAQEYTEKSDNIWRDKIGTQINIGDNGVYNENVINDISQIKEAIFGWWNENNEQELFILIACENEQGINTIENLTFMTPYYGENYCDWKPFKEEPIIKILQDYKEQAGFNLQAIVFNGIDNEDMGFWVFLEDVILPKLIVVTDGLALSEKAMLLSKSIDHKNQIGGFIIPLHEEIEVSVKNVLKELFKEKYQRMYTRFSSNWETPYSNIEISVGSKDVFFRRLTNLANNLNIKSHNLKNIFRCLETKGLGSLTNDAS